MGSDVHVKRQRNLTFRLPYLPLPLPLPAGFTKTATILDGLTLGVDVLFLDAGGAAVGMLTVTV